MANVTSRDELIEFCLRQLGHPVIEINIDPQQAEDCVDMALQLYYEYNIDGSENIFYKHTLTQIDLDNQYIILPYEILSITKVYPITNSYTKNIQYQSFISDVINQAKNGMLSNFLITNQYWNTIQSFLNKEQSFNYNLNNQKLKLKTDWSVFKVDDVILIECYKIVDPEEFIRIYNDRWLKAYTTALIKRQWSNNVKKYSNFQLPSGITLDGASWYQEAVSEVTALEQELRDIHEAPPMGLIG